jgi:O-antigen ligase
MAPAPDPARHLDRPAFRSASTRRTLPSASAIAARVHDFDNGLRPVLLGFALATGIAFAMAMRIDAVLPAIGWLTVVIALFAPTTGLTVIAALATLREPGGVGPLGFNATVIGACCLGALGRLALNGIAGRRIAIRPEFVGIGAFLGLTTFQFLRLAARTTDERERFGLSQLTDVTAGLLIIVLVAVVFTPTTRRWIIAATVPSILLAAVAAIASLNPDVIGLLPIGGLLPAVDVSVRGTGIFTNPNYLGLAMALGFLLVARSGRLELTATIARRPWLLATPVAIALMVSFSRGAFLALVCGVVALYVSRGRRVFALAAIVGVIVVAVGYPVLLTARHALIFGPAIASSGDAQAVSDASRIAVLEAGAKLFVSQPIIGIGVGQFHFESPRYLDGSPVTYPHNTYLQIAVEQGLLGITAFLLMLVGLVYALSRKPDAYSVTARAILVVFAVGSLFAEPLTSLQASALLWIATGAALVAPSPSLIASRSELGGSRPLLRPSATRRSSG